MLDDGGDEDEAIAALLHDAVEDQGGQKTLSRIRQQFGERVAKIVAACSDTDVTPKPPWCETQEGVHRPPGRSGAPSRPLRVSLADKLHNAQAILVDLRAGHDVFSRVGPGKVLADARVFEMLPAAFDAWGAFAGGGKAPGLDDRDDAGGHTLMAG